MEGPEISEEPSEISGRVPRFQRSLLRFQGGSRDFREGPEVSEEPSEVSGRVLRFHGGF